jgi:hypothetical protein
LSSLSFLRSIPGGNRVNIERSIENGKESKTATPAAGSTWHWNQTDCWYYTPAGTKKRDALFDENGERIRGKESKEAAQLALARVKLVLSTNRGPIENAHRRAQSQEQELAGECGLPSVGGEREDC